MGMKYMHFAYISKDFRRFYVAAASPKYVNDLVDALLMDRSARL